MDPAPVVTWVASQGLLGALLVIVGWFAVSKDRELKLEREARINDAKNYNELALKLQAQVLDSIDKLEGILNEMKGWVKVPPGRPIGGGR